MNTGIVRTRTCQCCGDETLSLNKTRTIRYFLKPKEDELNQNLKLVANTRRLKLTRRLEIVEKQWHRVESTSKVQRVDSTRISLGLYPHCNEKDSSCIAQLSLWFMLTCQGRVFGRIIAVWEVVPTPKLQTIHNPTTSTIIIKILFKTWTKTIKQNEANTNPPLQLYL